MILGRDLINALGLDIKFSGNIVIGGKGSYKGCSASMVDFSNDDFKCLTCKIVEPE